MEQVGYFKVGFTKRLAGCVWRWYGACRSSLVPNVNQRQHIGCSVSGHTLYPVNCPVIVTLVTAPVILSPAVEYTALQVVVQPQLIGYTKAAENLL